MRPTKNIEKSIRQLQDRTGAELDARTLSDACEALAKKQQTQSASDKPNIWRTIMKARMTKLAAAAGVVVAVLIGIKIIGGLAEEPPGQTVTQEESPATVEQQRIAEMLHTELSELRQMAAVGNVKGLSAMLSTWQFESKLVAANLLAKMVGMPLPPSVSMHASGELILDSHSGNLRLRSTNSEDWLELSAETLWVHTVDDISQAQQVRLTYDDDTNGLKWEERQKESAEIRQMQADLEKELAHLGQSSTKNIDQLKKRLADYINILDIIDGAIYVSIENGRLKLDWPTYHSIAFAELRDEIVRVERHGNVVEADSVTLLHRLAPVRTDGPPPPTPDWRDRFDKVYSLDEGEILRWVRSPFIPQRQIYATQDLNYYSTDNPPPPGYLYFRWDGKLRNWTLSMYECNLSLVLHSIGLNHYEYSDGSPELTLLNPKLGGDWIVRDNVPIEDKLLALEQILQSELGRAIKFEKRKVRRDVIIVSAQYKHLPLEGVTNPDRIYVYIDSCENYLAGSQHFGGPEPIDGGGRGIVKLIETVGSHFNRPIVFETENLSDINVNYLTSQSYSIARANAKTKEDKQEILDSVLQNLTKQTSLQFEYGQRGKDVWFITEQSKPK